MLTPMNPALSGEYEQSVDEKGRVFVPPTLHEPLGKDIVITRGPDKAIWLLSMAQWNAIYRQMDGTSDYLTDRHVAVLRRLHSGFTVSHVDSGNRLILPRHLRDYAGIVEDSNRAVVVGVGDKVEIWHKPVWREYSGSQFNLAAIYDAAHALRVDPAALGAQ